MGTHRIAALAHRMGITTPISTNPAMTIGGLKTGVTPLDMAHAYETIAHGGERVAARWPNRGPRWGSKRCRTARTNRVDHTRLHQVLPEGIATTETEMLETVLEYGTARSAALGQFAAGKTGTTSNYGDAWFVGWDHRYTVAVWVGFPNSLVPMLTEFDGGPVLGGTFPALIWHSFMVSATQVRTRTRRRRSGQAGRSHRQEDGRGHGRGPGRRRGSERSGGRRPHDDLPHPAAESSAGTGAAPKSHTGEAPAPASGAGKSGGAGTTEGSEGAQAPAQKGAGGSGAGGNPNSAPPAEAPAPSGSGGAPNQAPAPAEAPAPKVSGGTGAPTGGASPGG